MKDASQFGKISVAAVSDVGHERDTVICAQVVPIRCGRVSRSLRSGRRSSIIGPIVSHLPTQIEWPNPRPCADARQTVGIDVPPGRRRRRCRSGKNVAPSNAATGWLSTSALLMLRLFSSVVELSQVW